MGNFCCFLPPASSKGRCLRGVAQIYAHKTRPFARNGYHTLLRTPQSFKGRSLWGLGALVTGMDRKSRPHSCSRCPSTEHPGGIDARLERSAFMGIPGMGKPNSKVMVCGDRRCPSSSKGHALRGNPLARSWHRDSTAYSNSRFRHSNACPQNLTFQAVGAAGSSQRVSSTSR
jgi:hypothetical protein